MHSIYAVVYSVLLRLSESTVHVQGQFGVAIIIGVYKLSHSRYTGTQVCNDPERKVITILLTNRCYKNDTRESGHKIAKTRRMFNSAVKNVVNSF